MQFSSSDPSGSLPAPLTPQNSPPLPQLWIGYLLAFATFAAELIAVSLHPEWSNGERATPPLYLFLGIFIGLVYWLVCIYRFHVVMRHIPGWTHPISPARAVGFHFIPVYYLYWIFKWPKEIARFANGRFRQPLMKYQIPGVVSVAAIFVGPLLDPALGLFLLFFAASYVSAFLRRAIAFPPVPTENNFPPFS